MKDYKLVRSSVSDPVKDAKLACSVFRDQWESLHAAASDDPHLIDFYRFCFEDSLFNGFSGEGIAAVFGALGAKGFKSPEEALDFLVEKTDGIVCRNAITETALSPARGQRQKTGPGLLPGVAPGRRCQLRASPLGALPVPRNRPHSDTAKANALRGRGLPLLPRAP